MDDDPKIVEIDNTFIYIYKDDSGGGGESNHIYETPQRILLLLNYH